MQTGSSVHTPRTTVLMREVGDEAVLLDLDSGIYHTLNAVGTVIWNGLAGGKRPEQIVDDVVAAFEIDRARAERDFDEFTSTLHQRGLLAAPANER